jgi:hypothetical protein
MYSGVRKKISQRVAKAHREQWMLAYSLADELVGRTLKKQPIRRIEYAVKLLDEVRNAINRTEAGGRVLDLGLPQRCLFCGTGTYRPAHRINRNAPTDPFPTVEQRRKPYDPTKLTPSNPYEDLIQFADYEFGIARRGIPLVIVCDYCGNVQQFRLDLTNDHIGEHWRP